MKKTELKKLLSKLSVKEKILQLTQLTSSYVCDEEDELLTGPEQKNDSSDDYCGLGWVINVRGADRVKRIQTEFLRKSSNKIPLIFAYDVIHGYYTHYPINLGLAASFDIQLIEDCCSMASKEASLDGVDLTYAPCTDVCRDSRWGRCSESAGEDTYLNSEFAKACVKGFQGNLGKYKIAACVKHFGAYGAGESGLDYNYAEVTDRTLNEYYLPTYKSAIDAGVCALMTAFNSINGIPTLINKRLTENVLRKKWKFDGVTISDWGAFDELYAHGVAYDGEQIAKLCMDAAIDVEMMTTYYLSYLENIIKTDKVYEKKLNEAVLRILELKNRLGLFENPYKDASEEKAKEVLGCEEHLSLARKAAEESCVLLKNDNGVLPFGYDTESVAVIGPYAVSEKILGSWTCVENGKTVNVFKGVENLIGGKKVFFSEGCCYRDGTDEQLNQAVELAKKCKCVILCLGCAPEDSGEGCSKTSLDLPERQYKLLDAIVRVNKRVAVVIFTDRGLAVERLEKCAPAILSVWFPGTEGGNAIAELLFGIKNPCGKLPITFPKNVGQCPIYYNRYRVGRPRSNDNERCEYQSGYIDCTNAPLYPFGYGLSYTEFEYSEPYSLNTVLHKGEKTSVFVNVKNAGKFDGKEIVQLYVQDEVCSVVRPYRELKAFKKIALTQGETVKVEFRISEEELSFYNADGVKTVEKGYFRIYIGKDSNCSDYIRIKYE